MTLREAAEHLGVHYMTAYGYVRTGRLDAHRDGVEWRIRARDLTALADGRSMRARGHARVPATRLAARLLAGDEAGAWRVVETALVGGREPEAVHIDLVSPALRHIGRQWARGVVGIADEHLATVVAGRIVARLGPRFAHRGKKRGTIVLGCVAGERHALAGALLSDLLRGRRFATIDLGADTPAESFVEAAGRAERPVAVLLGAIGSGHEAAVRETLDALRDGGITTPSWVGGPGIRDRHTALQLGADGWTGHDARSALDAVESLAARHL